MKVHQYNEDTDEWEYYTEQDGVICQYIEQFLSKAWDKAKINANPEIKETCGLLKVSFIDFSLILICTMADNKFRPACHCLDIKM
jgi:hypothetical protein